ncbi:MAG TPA: hypothetical protein P5295_15620 [Spirochaetota bacterium]|nr:hypothetical protein [Spirochaetota bacterium]
MQRVSATKFLDFNEYNPNFEGNIFNQNARDNAIEEITNNEIGYMSGYQYWEGNDNVLLVKDGTDYYKVMRDGKDLHNNGKITVISYEEIKKDDYDKIIKDNDLLNDTWCNFVGGYVSSAYGAPNINNFNGVEYEANAINDNLSDGLYNNENGRFVLTDYETAQDYAASGGLSLASYKDSGPHGHIAVLTGGYGGDGSATMGNLNIFQAGSDFGKMTYYDGFKTRESQFYIWVK